MELSDLTVFRTVVQAGGITRAAEKLNRVQSNVTTRIRQLEEHLGVELSALKDEQLQAFAADSLDMVEFVMELEDPD